MYDLIIVGTGPAGLTAAIYAARYKMNFLVIGQLPGGTLTEAHIVENYPGLEGLPGLELGEKMADHAKKLGTEIVADSVKKIEKKNDHFVLYTTGKEYEAKRVIIASGSERAKLKIKGENELIGKGVAYCATCDGPFFKEKTVAVVGGANAAVTSALYLADIATKVYLIYRGEELKADPAWIQKMEENEKIEVIYNTEIEEIVGDSKVEKLRLSSGKELELDGVFIEIGSTPGKALISDLRLKTDERGYVWIDDEMKTSVHGVWAAGDITARSFKLRQAITAAAEGAIAAYSVYLDSKK